MDDNMLKFIEIRNSYARPKIGELSINEKALAEYEKFCLELIKQNDKQKEIIDKTIKAINEMLCGNFEISETEYLMGQNENTAFGVRAIELLEILEDKEV